MVPGHLDSAKFLFYNLINRFPNNPKTISLGKYPAGTHLVFMYKVVDTSAKWKYFANKKLYTGQNREGIDQYVSDRPSETNLYQKRFAAAGKVDSMNVEVGFSDGPSLSFWNLLFQIAGAKIVK